MLLAALLTAALTTPLPPPPPTAFTSSVGDLGNTGATLRGEVLPNGLPTTMHFEYGTTTAYGSSTPEQPAGTDTRTYVSAPVSGLAMGTEYHYRAVATNSSGVSRGADWTFRTMRRPTAVTLEPSTTRPTWGDEVSFGGKVDIPALESVEIQRLEAPFTGAFRSIGNTIPEADGTFRLRPRAFRTTTRLRAVTSGGTVMSPVVTISVAVKVEVSAQRLGADRVRLTGTTWPAVPAGRISLQRRTSTGRWVLAGRATPAADAGDRSRYAFTVRRGAHATRYRVSVLARDGGAHVPGRSRTITVPRQ